MPVVLLPEYLFRKLGEDVFGWTTGMTGPRAKVGSTEANQSVMGVPMEGLPREDEVDLRYLAGRIADLTSADEGRVLSALSGALPDCTAEWISLRDWKNRALQKLPIGADVVLEAVRLIELRLGLDENSIKVAKIPGIDSIMLASSTQFRCAVSTSLVR